MMTTLIALFNPVRHPIRRVCRLVWRQPRQSLGLCCRPLDGCRGALRRCG